MSVRPTGFRLRVPASWVEFDIWRATRTGDLSRLLDGRIRQDPALAPSRRALLDALRAVARDAERQGALFCAAMLDRVGDQGMLVATAMVFQTPGGPDPSDNTVEAIAGQVTSVAGTDDSPHWRRVETLDLPAGRAVRVRGVETVRAGGATIDCVVMQTLIPVPDGPGVLNVVLTSPQTQLTEPFLDLFDAISSTLAWTPEPAGERAGH